MRSFSLIVSMFGLALSAQAQTLNLGQPLTSPNNGNPNGAVYFNITVTNTLTWDSLTYVASDVSNTGTSSVKIFFGPAQWQGFVSSPAAWTEVGETAGFACANGSDTVITSPISGSGPNTGNTVTFAPGNYGIALVATTHSWGYQNGVISVNDANLSVTLGGASNAPFALPTFSPRSMNGAITYSLGGTPIPLATSANYGAGCYASYQSFYESMGNTATNQDLSNTSILLTLNGDHYDVTTGTNPIVPPGVGAVPIAFVDNNTATQVDLLVPFTFLTSAGVTTSPVDPVTGNFFCKVSPDCFVGLDAGAATGGNPAIGTKLTDGASIGNHVNCDSMLGGTVTSEFDGVTGNTTITWDQVPSNTLTSTNTVQIEFFTNGNIELRLGALDLLIGGGWPTMVGYFAGAGALDPGSIDISASAPFSTGGFDQDPFHLESNSAPVVGTNASLTASDAPTVSVGLIVVSTTPADGSPIPPIPGFLFGADGCTAYVASLDASVAINNIVPGSMSTAFPIANTPSLVGVKIGCQAAWVQPGVNSIGLALSNGVLLNLGL